MRTDPNLDGKPKVRLGRPGMAGAKDEGSEGTRKSNHVP